MKCASARGKRPGWASNSRFGFGGGRVAVRFAGKTVFDRLYVEHLSYQRDPFRPGTHIPQPGRSRFVDVSLLR